MHDDLEPFSQSPSQNFCKNLFDIINPKFFNKSQNLGQNACNVWLKARKEIIPVKYAMKSPKDTFTNSKEIDQNFVYFLNIDR